MGKSLNEIALELKDNNKKVQLIYAFNGTGKTRLSKEFKSLIEPKSDLETEETETTEATGLAGKKILYYNAFTEDLFYWDNDLLKDAEPKLKIQPNDFTHWIFVEQGQDGNVIKNFQYYTDEKLAPHFNAQYTVNVDNRDITIPDFSEVTFSYERGNDERSDNIKISKGEESCFVWSVFYALLEQAIEVLNIDEDSIYQERETDNFDNLKYVFIDDPVTSLDDNHLIQMAVDLAKLIKRSKVQNGLKFVITTHNPLFYNVIYNELGTKNGYMLDKNEDGSYDLDVRFGDSNRNFSYHHYLIGVIKEAVDNNQIEKYHFILLRNLYEKAANFLGYKNWSELLPEDKEAYASRIMNFYSHRTLLNEEVREPTEPEKQTVKLLFNYLIDHSKFSKEA